MDIDAYVATHRPSWQRLERLMGRRRLTGAEADELVRLYQRTATHLSVVRSSCPDPTLVGQLSSLVARARAEVTGVHTPAWQDAARFFTVGFPAICYRTRRWSLTVAALVGLLSWAVATWVAGSPQVEASIATPEDIQRLSAHAFTEYYSSAPAGSFGAHVWTNNAFISATCLVSGILLLPVIWILFQNAVSLGVTAGLMASTHRMDVFFELITPHGLLELTSVFVSAGAGLRLGWTLIDPGQLPRGEAVASVGRATVGTALGVTVMLLISGSIEAFVTPSGLPALAKVSIGVLAEALFLTYVIVLGRRAVRAGESGDIAVGDRGDRAPTSA